MPKDKGWDFLNSDDVNGTFNSDDDDGSWGYKNEDGSGSYYGADGSWGYQNADGSLTRAGRKHLQPALEHRILKGYQKTKIARAPIRF